MDLSTYNFPEIKGIDFAFSTKDTTPELVEEAKKRNPQKGIEKFNQIFYTGGEIMLKDDVNGTWKEKAIRYAIALMRSYTPNHNDKEIVCAMLFEECLVL